MRTYSDIPSARAALVREGPAEWILPVNGRKPIKIIANDAIMAGFDDKVFEQAVNTAEAPGVYRVIVNPDGHAGYGCPVGSVVITDGMIYPGPVGPDICCSMSYLETNVPDDVITDRATRRALINAIVERIPTGMGGRSSKKAPKPDIELIKRATVFGATKGILESLEMPFGWGERLECSSYGNPERLYNRLANHDDRIVRKLLQCNELGSGNHFCEGESASVPDETNHLARQWGIHHGHLGFLTHCGSRGFGFQLAALHFKGLEHHFSHWGIPLPSGERELIYAPVDSPEGQAYLDDMYLGANFAVINHLLINRSLVNALNEVLGPSTDAQLVYHISHNIGREEIVDGCKRWVFRKGATRAFPAGHHGLKNTPYEETGHPILLPGNPTSGSYIMVGSQGAEKTAFSINHGAGRAMGRNAAKRTLDQAQVDAGLLAADILHNGRQYPLDEAPAAYKDFEQVTKSVEEAGLAKVVAKLNARFVIKDNEGTAEGAA